MTRIIDSFLNRFTTYRLTLYYVAALLVLGFVLSLFGVLPGGPVAIVSTVALLLAVCLVVNRILARILRINANPESSIITALILALIMAPVSVLSDLRHAAILAAAGTAAIASKYALAWKRQHPFNPAAVGALVAGLAFGTWATWWVGSTALLPLVLAGGLLLARKIARFRLLGTFFLFFLVFNAALGLVQGAPVDLMLQSIPFVFGQTALLFFGFVMFTEPASSPKRLVPQVVYAAIVAFLYQPQLAMFGANLTPEEALLIGNLFSFFISPSFKLRAPLKDRREIGEGISGLVFPKPAWFSFVPGQYMEWSIPLRTGDSRGNRRYFSIASSPTEPDILIAARFPPHASRYKQELMSLPPGGVVTAGELGGDFVLPRDPGIPLAFVAGGIGITPFRSMLKYLADKGEKRDIVLLYSNYAEQEIVFLDVLKEAECRIGLRVVHTLTDPTRVRPGWCGRTGIIDAAMIREEIPDCRSRHFMVSGSPGMVNAAKSALRSAGVPRSRIRSDYFPGYSM
jgi:glycine betaine catabolism B